MTPKNKKQHVDARNRNVGGGGKKKRDKGIQKVAILSNNDDFLCFLTFPENLFFWGHFWKYKPPGGLPETRPGFLETQNSAKSQGLKTVWSIYFNDFLLPVGNR